MKPATHRLLLLGTALAMLLGCAWGVWDSRRPVPEPLLQAAGTVTSARIVKNRGRDREVVFRLQGDEREFSYHQGLPNVEAVMAQLRVGSEVALQLGPRGRFDIWALRLDGREMLTPQQRLASQRGGGYVAAALGVLMVLLARWVWRVMDPRR